MRQWMLRITAYTDRLENELSEVNWPEGIKKLQRDLSVTPAPWMFGKLIERRLVFQSLTRQTIRFVFIRLVRATYMVLAPEHAAVETLTTTDQAAMVKRYCNDAAINSDLLGHGVWEHVGNEIKGVTNNA